MYFGLLGMKKFVVFVAYVSGGSWTIKLWSFFEVNYVGYINKCLVLIDRLWQVSTSGGPNSF